MRHAGILLSFCVLWAQQGLSWRPLKETLEKKWQTLSGALVPPYARTTNTIWLPDSMWVDTFRNGNWEERELTTYTYRPDNQIDKDTLYAKVGAQWRAQSTTQYSYYTTGTFQGADSLHLYYEDAGGNGNLLLSGKTAFYFTAINANYWKVEMIDSIYDNTSWRADSRVTAWGSPALLSSQQADSAYIAQYDTNQNQWVTAIKIYNYFTAPGVDSTYIWVDLAALGVPFPGAYGAGFSKYYYDAQSRLVRKRDTFWLCIGSCFPAQAGNTWYFYAGSAPKPSQDSSATYDYGSSGWSYARNQYTYDAHWNTLIARHDTCNASATPPACVPVSRERYHYIQRSAPSALVGGSSSVAFLPTPLQAGTRAFLDSRWGSQYELWDLSGRLIGHGDIPASGLHLTLPTQPGLYLLRIGNATQKLLLLP